MNKAREKIIEDILNVLKEDKIPFNNKWISSQKNFNMTTDKEYRGINQFILAFYSVKKGLNDPRWCTFAQAKANKWKVSKGAEGVPIEFWSLYDTYQKKQISKNEAKLLVDQDKGYQKNIKAIAKIYTVFNAKDIDGVPELKKEEIDLSFKEVFADEVLNTYLDNEDIKLTFLDNRAFYRKSDDTINLPKKELFKSEYDYLSVLAHEICHSTASSKRLNRPLIDKLLEPKKYALEELRAEISSSFLCMDLEIEYTDHDIQNHKAYIQSWLQLIQEAPMELFRAINDSQEIADFVKEKGDYVLIKEKAHTIETSNNLGVRDRMALALLETRKETKPIENELFSGSNLSGSGLYFEDLQVALATGKDCDGVDIPNDTPEEMNLKVMKHDDLSR